MLGNPALNNMVRNTIYQLKLRYGAPITVYRLLSGSVDLDTGVKTATKESHDIRRAAILPSAEARKFLTSIAFITASKNFASAGIQGWDQSQRGFVIDSRDLRNFEFQPEDWIVYRNKRYEVVMIEALEFDSGWLIIGKETKGNVPEQIINLNVVDTLQITDQESETVE